LRSIFGDPVPGVVKDCRCREGIDVRVPSVGVLSADETRPFWVDVVAGHVRVGTGDAVGAHVLLEWQSPADTVVAPSGARVGLMSTTDAAEWNVCFPGRERHHGCTATLATKCPMSCGLCTYHEAGAPASPAPSGALPAQMEFESFAEGVETMWMVDGAHGIGAMLVGHHFCAAHADEAACAQPSGTAGATAGETAGGRTSPCEWEPARAECKLRQSGAVELLLGSALHTPVGHAVAAWFRTDGVCMQRGDRDTCEHNNKLGAAAGPSGDRADGADNASFPGLPSVPVLVLVGALVTVGAAWAVVSMAVAQRGAKRKATDEPEPEMKGWPAAPGATTLAANPLDVGTDGARNPVGHAMDWNGMEPRATPWGDDFGSTWSLAMDAEIEAAFDLPKLDGADGFGYSVRGRYTAILRRRYSVPVGILHINENGVRTEE
jgi:hypothetical protein